MKKLFLLCLAVVLTVSVCGCAAETKPSAGDVTTTTATTTASTTTTKRTGSTTTTTTTTTTTGSTTEPSVTTTQPTTAPTTTVPTGSTTAPTGSTTAKPTLQTVPTKPTVPMPTFEISAEELAEKVYCTATIEDNFEEQVVLITLHKSVSATHHLFTVEEFREMFGIEIVKAEDLFWIDPKENPDALVNWDKYRQMYTLTIPQTGKQAVLDAIKIIEQHPYVRHAGPNHIYTLEGWD